MSDDTGMKETLLLVGINLYLGTWCRMGVAKAAKKSRPMSGNGGVTGDALYREVSRGGWKEQVAETNRKEEKQGMESSGRVLRLPAGSLLKPRGAEGKEERGRQN